MSTVRQVPVITTAPFWGCHERRQSAAVQVLDIAWVPVGTPSAISPGMTNTNKPNIDIDNVAHEIAAMHLQADSAQCVEGEVLATDYPIAWATGASDVDQDVRFVAPHWVASSDRDRDHVLAAVEAKVIDEYRELTSIAS